MRNRKGTDLRLHKFRGAFAKIRAFWHTIIRNDDGELCYECGRPYGLWWCPDDELWARVTKATSYRDGCFNGLCCPRCFERRAASCGVVLEWAPRVFMDGGRYAGGWH